MCCLEQLSQGHIVIYGVTTRCNLMAGYWKGRKWKEENTKIGVMNCTKHDFQKCRLSCVDRAVKNTVLRVDRNFQWQEKNPDYTRYSPVTSTKSLSQHRLCRRQFPTVLVHQKETHRSTTRVEQHDSSKLFDKVVQQDCPNWKRSPIRDVQRQRFLMVKTYSDSGWNDGPTMMAKEKHKVKNFSFLEQKA